MCVFVYRSKQERRSLIDGLIKPSSLLHPRVFSAPVFALVQMFCKPPHMCVCVCHLLLPRCVCVCLEKEKRFGMRERQAEGGAVLCVHRAVTKWE